MHDNYNSGQASINDPHVQACLKKGVFFEHELEWFADSPPPPLFAQARYRRANGPKLRNTKGHDSAVVAGGRTKTVCERVWWERHTRTKNDEVDGGEITVTWDHLDSSVRNT